MKAVLRLYYLKVILSEAMTLEHELNSMPIHKPPLVENIDVQRMSFRVIGKRLGQSEA